MLADAVRQRLHPEARRHLHHRPQHQLHERLHGAVRVLRLLPRPALEGRLPPQQGAARRRRSRRRSRSAATRSCCRAGCTPTSASSSTRSSSAGSRRTYPIWIHGLSPAEVKHIVQRLEPDHRGDAAPADRAPGSTRSPGGGAEVLSDRVRNDHRHRQGHDRRLARGHGGRAPASGCSTTATMMFGHVETLEERDRPPAAPARPAGPHRRLHRLHRLDLPAHEHRAGRRRADVVPVPAHAGGGARRCSTTSRACRPRGSPRAARSARSRCASAPTTSAA